MKLRVNGRVHELAIDPSVPLLQVLRNDLGLRAAKFGCGLEQCGACTVIVGAEAMPSCRIPVSQIGDREVLTVEGLASGDTLHPVQQAFLDEGAGQCAYCIPGIVMAVVALLAWNSAPDDAQVRSALSGHLCRCGAHPRILRAVQRAARASAQ